MRCGRAFTAGRGQLPLHPSLFPSANIFTRAVMASASLYEDQKYAKRLGNQLNYMNEKYSYDGKAAPSFYGYAGMGGLGVGKGFTNIINFKSFTPPIFVMPPGAPTKTVEFVEPGGGLSGPEPEGECVNTTPRPSTEFWNNLRLKFLEVPIPDRTKCLFYGGRLQAVGTDSEIIIWSPSLGKMWEMWRFAKYPSSTEYKCSFGGVHNVTTWNGVPVLSPYEGAVAASFLTLPGGLITHQDLVEVLRGGKIKHALSVSVQVTAPLELAPAIAHDSFSNSAKEYEDPITKEKVVNPAYGKVDEIPEGSWFRFPPESRASDYGLTGKLEIAIYEAIREYGLFLRDSAGVATFHLESFLNLGSPYCWNKVNPYHGNTTSATMELVNEIVPASWTDPTLPIFTEATSGTSSAVFAMCQKAGGTFEQVVPFSS